MTADSGKEVKQDPRAVLVSMQLQRIARAIDLELQRVAGGPMLFSPIVWPTGPRQRSQYVSNVARPAATKALEEMLERWKNGMPDVPLHEVS